MDSIRTTPPAAARGTPGRAAWCLLCALGLTALPACERWTSDPRQRVRKLTGGEPLNQIITYGSGPMPLNRVLELPQCDVLLNGEFAYRMVLDTGGGDSLLLSPVVAEEIGLETVSGSQMMGVGGISEGGLALVDELAIGEIRCARVLAFVADEGVPLTRACDGVIGTGILADGRVKLDFVQAELVVSPSSGRAEAAEQVTIHLGPNAHVFTTVQLQASSAMALLDSGANMSAFSPRWLAKNYPDHPVLDLPLPQFAVGTDVATSGTITSADLVFAGRQIENMAGIILPDLDGVVSRHMQRRVDVVVGMTVFREVKSWTVDFPREKMWIAWLEDE